MGDLNNNRLFSSLIVILKNKVDIEIPEKLINYFSNINYNFNCIIDKSLVKKYKLDKKFYDEQIKLDINNRHKKISNLNEILHEVYNVKLIDKYSEYDMILDNDFISIRVKRDILNNLNFIYSYESKKRKIMIVSNKYEESSLIEILSILDLFDLITNKENNYYINIYMSKLKKVINNNIDYLNGDNINSGSTLPGYFITIWRKEEVNKVLIHELVHYLKIDMINYQYKFNILYKDINFKDHKCNPNEAYTEFIAILIFTFWTFKKKGLENNKLNKYIKNRLLIELGWSYFQIGKILNFFKCYNSYEDLFKSNCIFNQKTNVLSYFILKTYLLKNLKNSIEYINFETFKQNDILTSKLLNKINLHEEDFKNIINWCINYYKTTKIKINHNSLRMSCLD